MAKPLKIEASDKLNCTVEYNLNKFEVYHATGWMMFSATSKEILREELAINGIVNPTFSGFASQKYLQK